MRDDAAFAATVETYLKGGAVAGWEPAEKVVHRIHQAVDGALRLGFVGLVSHGTALSLYVQHLGLVGDAWEFWAGLTTPDGWLVDGSTITRLGGDDGACIGPGG